MPMMKGFSPKVVSGNISEMMKSGHPRTQAIAASLANGRKYKKMAKGGMVGSPEEFDDNSDPMVPHKGHGGMQPMPDETSMSKMMMDGHESDEESTLNENRMNGAAHPDVVANPATMDEAMMFAKALKKKAMMKDMDMGYAEGGLVEGEADDMEVGNKPDEDMEDGVEDKTPMPMKASASEHMMNIEPSGMGLSAEAKAALERKKKMRRYS